MKVIPAGLAVVLAAGVAVWAQTGQPPKPGAATRPSPRPQPSIVPVSWQLEFDFKDPKPIILMLPGEKRPQTFWYMLFEVSNKTPTDQIFVPSFVMYTDSGHVQPAGKKVPTSVFRAILKRHNNPLLVNMVTISGRLLQGEDNAKEGVAIWPDFDPRSRQFDIFIGGLSGERAKVKLPAPIVVTETDDDGKVKKVTKTEIVLSKTLHLQYKLVGEAAARAENKPKLELKEWVMR